MYPIQFPQTPEHSGSYVPYFYQRGLHYLYPIEVTGRSRRPYDSAASPYDFSRMQGPFDSVTADAQASSRSFNRATLRCPKVTRLRR